MSSPGDNERERIWERALPDAHHVVLCELYHLKKFLAASKGRREQYLGFVRTFEMTLKSTPCGSSDQVLLQTTALVLGRDRTFLSFVTHHGGAEEARDPDRWGRVLEAGAGAIYGEYLSATGGSA